MKTTSVLKPVFTGLLMCYLFNGSIAHSQNEVRNWHSFVQSSNNPIVKDTFLRQSFEGDPSDNWKYQLNEKAELFYFEFADLSGGMGKKAVKLKGGGHLSFTRFDAHGYTEPMIWVEAGGKNCNPYQLLLFNSFRSEDEQIEVIKPKSKGQNYKLTNYWIAKKQGEPKGFEAYHNDEKATIKTGYYIIDNVLVHGSIPEYSFIEAGGDWNDSLKWSHLPPARNRKALLAAEIFAKAPIHCKQIWIGKGSLSMKEASDLHIDQLILYDNLQDKGSYYSTGNTYITGSTSVIKTFPSKGLWYFVSFPFDVYPDGIEQTFTHKDDTETDSGNFYYIKRYNHHLRADKGRLATNWEVIKTAEANENTPLLKKNVGYLFALDEGATQTTLRFQSTSGTSSPDFGRTGEIDLYPAFGAVEEDNGWFLCGNPLPGYLPLKNIEHNPLVTDEIWVYNGVEYTAYPAESDYVLPPFSAFFVKAAGETQLKIKAQEDVLKGQTIIPTHHPLNNEKAEPGDSPTSNLRVDPTEVTISVQGKQLHIKGAKENSKLAVYNIQGVSIDQAVVTTDYYILPVALPTGIYIVTLSSPNQNVVKKVYIQ